MEEVYAHDEGEADEWPIESPNDNFNLDDDSALAKALAESMQDPQQPGASSQGL
jgi:hypothetical protein